MTILLYVSLFLDTVDRRWSCLCPGKSHCYTKIWKPPTLAKVWLSCYRHNINNMWRKCSKRQKPLNCWRTRLYIMLFRHWKVCLTDYKGFILSLVSEGFRKTSAGEGAGRHAALRTLVLSRMERRRLRGDLTVPDRFLRRGKGRQRSLSLFFGIQCQGMGKWLKAMFIAGGLDWTLGSIYLPRGRSHTGKDFLEWWLILFACQCLRVIQSHLPLITSFSFWSV